MGKVKNLKGKRFGKLVAIEFVGIGNRHYASVDVMIWTVMNMRRSVRNMKLIDADDFIKKFSYAKANTEEENVMCATVRRMIKEQPTAFDLDKAISELKRDKFVESECILSDVHQGYNAGLSRAIEIVKGGGVE